MTVGWSTGPDMQAMDHLKFLLVLQGQLAGLSEGGLVGEYLVLCQTQAIAY